MFHVVRFLSNNLRNEYLKALNVIHTNPLNQIKYMNVVDYLPGDMPDFLLAKRDKPLKLYVNNFENIVAKALDRDRDFEQLRYLYHLTNTNSGFHFYGVALDTEAVQHFVKNTNNTLFWSNRYKYDGVDELNKLKQYMVN